MLWRKKKKKETSAVKYNTSGHYRGRRYKKLIFWSRRHISTSGFTSMATEIVIFALFLSVQPSDRY